MSDINTRIDLLISELGLNKNSFSKRIGVSNSVIQNIVGERKSKPGFSLLNDIVSKLNVSAHWLLTGEGKMFLDGSSETNVPKEQGSSTTNALQHLLEHEKEERQKKEEELAKLYREIGKLEQQNESLAEALAKAQKEVEAKTAEMETTLIEVGKNRERIEHLEEERSRILAKLSQFTDISPFETKSAS